MKKLSCLILCLIFSLPLASCRQVPDGEKIVPKKGPAFVSGFLFEEKVELVWGYQKDSSYIRNEYSYTKNYLGSALNADIKLIELPLLKIAEMASMCDILQVDRETASKLASSGLIWDLSEAYSRGFFPDYRGNSAKWYLLPVADYEDKKGAGFFAQAGSGLSSNRTFDAMLSAVEKAPGDKTVFAALWSPERLFSLMAYPYGVDYTPGTAAVYDEKSQRWACSPGSEKGVELLRRLSSLYQSGRLKFLDRDEFDSAIEKNECLTFFDFYCGSGYMPATLRNSAGEVRGYYSDIAAGDKVFCISASSKYKEQTAHFLNFLYTDYGAELTNYGVCGMTWNTAEEGEATEFIYEAALPLTFEADFRFFDIEYDLGKNRLAARVLDRRASMIKFFDSYNRQNRQSQKAFSEKRHLCPVGYTLKPVLPPLKEADQKRANTLIDAINVKVASAANGVIFSSGYDFQKKLSETAPLCAELERILNGENS